MNDELDTDLLPIASRLRTALHAEGDRAVANATRRGGRPIAHSAASDGFATERSPVIVQLEQQLHYPSRRRWIVGVAATLLVALAAIALLSRDRPLDVSEDGKTRFFLPGKLPDGLQLDTVTHSGAEAEPPNVVSWKRIYTLRSADATLLKTLTITTDTAPAEREQGVPLEEPEIVVAGNTGRILDRGSSIFAIFEEDFTCGRVVVDSIQLGFDDFKQSVSSLACIRDANGDFAVLTPPPGFRLEAEGNAKRETWSLQYSAQDRDIGPYILGFERSDEAADLSFSSGGRAVPTTKGNRVYWIIAEADPVPGQTGIRSVAWREGDYKFSLLTSGRSTDDVLAFADSVRQVTRATFDEHIADTHPRTTDPREAEARARVAPIPGVIPASLPPGWRAIHVLPDKSRYALGLLHSTSGRGLSIEWSTTAPTISPNSNQIAGSQRTITVERPADSAPYRAVVTVGEFNVVIVGSELTDEEIKQIADNLQAASAEDYGRYIKVLPYGPLPSR